MNRNEILKKSAEIRQFILDQVAQNPSGLTNLIVQKFSISRQAAARYLQEMSLDGQIIAEGTTKDRVYKPGLRRTILKKYPLNGSLEESEIWSKDFMVLCAGLKENVARICEYGFTEMVNNAIDHSNGKNLTVGLERNTQTIRIVVVDDGVGIFTKIKQDHHLSDERQAILELAKGKLTSDPEKHSGQGIFFTSKAFEDFFIHSHDLAFGHQPTEERHRILDGMINQEGTAVHMQIHLDSERKLRDVFDDYANPEDDNYSFDKTMVPIRLIQYEGESLLSRSQAKRLLSRIENFRTVLLDFDGIQSVGPAFADEIFRVYKSGHPHVALLPVNASGEILKTIQQAKSNVLDGAFQQVEKVEELIKKGLVEPVSGIDGAVMPESPSYRIVKRDMGSVMEILPRLSEADRKKIQNIYGLENYLPEASETKENVVFLFKHFINVMDANIQKNELQRLIKSQALVFKFFEHVGSYIFLSKGTNIPEIVPKTYYDIGTLSVTARAVFETMLAFHYVAIEPTEIEEFEFRINCLLYSGLLERAEAFDTFTKGSKINLKEKMETEKNDIEVLKNKISSSNFFHALNPGEQNNIIVNGIWKLKRWKQIAVSAGIDEEHFRTTYGYLCTQAHSEGNSFIQMRTAIVEKNINRGGSIADVSVLAALSFMIDFLVKISPYSKARHENDSKAFGYVNFYLNFYGSKLREL